MKTIRLSPLCLRVCGSGLAFAVLLAWAQGPTGQISGTVNDPRQAAVPGAALQVTNEATAMVRQAVTGPLGEYTVPLLSPGVYTVEVSKQGFRIASYPGIEVRVDEDVRMDVALQLGILEQKLVVTGAAPLIDSNTPKVGYVLDTPNVQGLPLNERNFLSFSLLVPGVQMPADGSQNIQTSGSFSVNGAREQSNNFLLDGVDNNDPFNNQYSVLPPVEAIREFKVQSTSSSAEFGRTAGAQINIVLKSGGNSLHGSAFELVRNRHLDARNFFDRPDCPPGLAPGTCAASLYTKFTVCANRIRRESGQPSPG
jgi:hypothetical protein